MLALVIHQRGHLPGGHYDHLIPKAMRSSGDKRKAKDRLIPPSINCQQTNILL